jgi:hypothetical protein
VRDGEPGFRATSSNCGFAFACKTKRPRLNLSLGTSVDQPSPKCCSRRRLSQARKPVNGSTVLLLCGNYSAAKYLNPNALRDQGRIRDSRRAEDAPVARNLLGRSQRFRVIIGELHCRLPFYARYFADQTDRIEPAITAGIAAAKVVGQQRAPAGAETDAPARSPLRGRS